jgi:hypothetical protein
MGMVGMGCTDLLSRNFENENEGGGGEAQSDALRYSGDRLRWEIGRCMSSGGIRGAGLIWPIKTIKRRSNSLN